MFKCCLVKEKHSYSSLYSLLQKIEPPHGRPDKSELFSSDPVDHDHKKDQETALTEWVCNKLLQNQNKRYSNTEINLFRIRTCLSKSIRR